MTRAPAVSLQGYELRTVENAVNLAGRIGWAPDMTRGASEPRGREERDETSGPRGGMASAAPIQ